MHRDTEGFDEAAGHSSTQVHYTPSDGALNTKHGLHLEAVS